MAQTKTITGTIKDSGNEPIPGASVLVKGTTNGTVTDINGNYNLSVNGNNAVLVFSFLGMKSQEVAVGNQSQINITLVSDQKELDELIVVGYGVQKKKLNTGATIQVKGEELQKMNSVSAFSAMQGKTPGVNIVQKSGKPGEGFKVTVRGLGTIGDATPLYIVDGIQTGIENVNPSDIESIDVLKDAASAAIYGARGANGVIIVTTKSGKGGKTQLSYDAYYGVQNMYKKLDFCNAQEYMALQDVASLNSTGARINWEQKGINKATVGEGTNWLEEALNKNAVTQSHTFSMSGGSDKGNFSSSVSYASQEGIIGVGHGETSNERFGFRLNSENKLIENVLTFGQHLYLTRINDSGIGTGGLYGNSIRGLYTTHPLMANKDADGNYITTSEFNKEVGNPVAAMAIKETNGEEKNKLVGDVYLNIQPLKNLTVKTMFAIDYYGNSKRAYTPNYGYFTTSDVVDFDKVSMSAGHGTTWTWDNTATYNLKLVDHSVTAMIGSSVQSFSGEYMYTEKQDCSFDSFDLAYLNSCSTIENATKAEGKAENDVKSSSFFGRVSYDFKEKYMATVTLRRDASSKFGSNNRWGTFPSASVGWLISNEGFFPQTPIIDYFKLRASWGQNGNDKIDAFRYLATISSKFYYPTGSDDSNHAVASVPGRGANPNLKWETSEQMDLGFDARLFNSKLSVAFDGYRKTTKDWLVQAPILAIKGTTAPYINGGNVTNSGVELALTWNDKIGDVSYSIGVNGAYNKNKVTNIPNSDGIIHGDGNVLWQGLTEIYRAEEGYPIGYFWGYETAGIFKNATEIANHKNSKGTVIQPKAQPGDVIFVDRDDNGKLDDNDKTQIGNPHPDYTFGFNFNVEYKGFDLSMSATGVAGNQIAKGMVDFSRPATTNYTKDFYTNSWSTSNSTGTLPRMLTSTEQNWKKFSPLYLENGDYLRIQNVTLGYDFDKLVKTPFGQLRVYVQAQNLMTFTKYSGMDPEIGYAPQDWAAGVDIGYYPHPRTYLAGVSIKF